MRILNYIIIACLVLAAASCKKEAVLVASKQTFGYTLPQGNHPYDKTITDFYNKYGVYMLYKFTDKDTYWTPTGWKNATLDANGVGTTGYLATPADTSNGDYISRQITVLNKLWFGFYTDKFLKQFLPTKIMLCSSVDSIYATYIYSPVYRILRNDAVVGAWANFDNINVNYGNAAVMNMTQTDSIKFAKKVNLIFAQSIITRNLAAPTADFTAVTNYATYTSQATAYANGILTTYYSSPTALTDWSLYIQAMVSCTEATLNKSRVNTDASLVGILNPVKDTNGKIRQRYNIVRNYFINNYGVDLQAIGNYTGR
ncbi:hypothetical protein MUY27_08555 [Mucilaginibacter sp. RS28]|uniref:Zinc-binding metallo-peptidase n=1 Tax=Mucilaginibacter straminoryzae TaxID=2932774 RepID=A0A9X1X546_9SPHI|nr:hypothetical protein [Mucilaginibacter straminoryzae]MCJ8209758.1 hypothetical protein [Mucilaginibacter straminoryzae]